MLLSTNLNYTPRTQENSLLCLLSGSSTILNIQNAEMNPET